MNKPLRWKSHVAMLTLAAATLGFNVSALAHGSTKPEHGGIVQMSGETVLELTVSPDSVALYVKEEDEELASAGMSAKLTIVYKGVKSEVTLQPAAGNKFEGKGVKIASGSKVAVMLIKKATQTRVSVNFSIE